MGQYFLSIISILMQLFTRWLFAWHALCISTIVWVEIYQWNFKLWLHPLHQNDSHLWTVPWARTIWLSFINDISSWNAKVKITIFIAVLHTQAPDALQPGVLTWRWVGISKDASMQPRFRGSEVQERRKRTVGSLFLSKYSGKKWKQWVAVTSGWKQSTGNDLKHRGGLWPKSIPPKFLTGLLCSGILN